MQSLRGRNYGIVVLIFVTTWYCTFDVVVSIFLCLLWPTSISLSREVLKCHSTSCMLWTRAWRMRTCRRWRSLCRCLWVYCPPLPWWASSPLDAWSRCTSWGVRAYQRATSSEAPKTSVPSSYRWGFVTQSYSFTHYNWLWCAYCKWQKLGGKKRLHVKNVS